MSYTVDVGRFITPPLKKSADVDLTKALQTFIKNTYDKTDEDLKKHIREFNSLRKSAVVKAQDKSAASLNVLLQYYDQFSSLNRKVPFRETGGVHVTFSWKDALEKGSFLSGSSKITSSEGEFERLMVIFNIAALKSQIAGEANLSSDDELKNAAKHFQEAAGMFEYIKDNILSTTNQNPTSDLSPGVLSFFRSLMVAQAQECFYAKANSDKMKPDILAKVACQASSLYAEVISSLSECGNSLPSNVSSMCNTKKSLYEMLAQFQQANVAHNNKKFGEEIARLKKVEPSLKPLLKNHELLQGFNIKELTTKVGVQLKDAEKENNFIYHDPIPKELASIGKAPIAKSKQFNTTEVLGARFVDVFLSLVPLAVHDALESYETRRKEIVDHQVGRLRELNTLINGVMSSLNLPAALEDMGGDSLPPSILEKSQVVISKGGVQIIENLQQELPESLQRNQQLLNECLRIMNEEQRSDDELRAKFGEKWKRTPSATLTAPLRQEAIKYQKIIENAQKADGIIREKIAGHKEGIDMLCMNAQQLKSAIPSSSPLAALKDKPVVVELRQLCEQVEALKAEREVMESELKSTKSDMTNTFTEALASDGVLNEEAISVSELDQLYEPLITQVTESAERQESVLANLQRASEQFSVLKSQGGGANSREDVLKKIAAAFDGYQELLANLQEGSKFYNDLTELLLKLQGKCGDLIFARKTEKEELLKDLQQNIVSQSGTDSSTEVPIYQQVTKKTAPTRPPPPEPKSTPQTAAPSHPVPAPRQAPVSTATTTPAVAPPTAPNQPHVPPGGQPPPANPYQGQPPYGGAPYGYSGYQQPPPMGYPPQGGYNAPYPQQPYGGYPQQPYGAAPYPQQPYPGYPPQPGQPPAAGYPHQPPGGYYYPPQ